MQSDLEFYILNSFKVECNQNCLYKTQQILLGGLHGLHNNLTITLKLPSFFLTHSTKPTEEKKETLIFRCLCKGISECVCFLLSSLSVFSMCSQLQWFNNCYHCYFKQDYKFTFIIVIVFDIFYLLKIE